MTTTVRPMPPSDPYCRRTPEYNHADAELARLRAAANRVAWDRDQLLTLANTVLTATGHHRATRRDQRHAQPPSLGQGD